MQTATTDDAAALIRGAMSGDQSRLWRYDGAPHFELIGQLANMAALLTAACGQAWGLDAGQVLQAVTEQTANREVMPR